MQETRYEGVLEQKVYSGKDQDEVREKMIAALRPGEEVIRRRELSLAEVHAWHKRNTERNKTRRKK
jgi:hypothetical protein